MHPGTEKIKDRSREMKIMRQKREMKRNESGKNEDGAFENGGTKKEVVTTQNMCEKTGKRP